MSRAPGGVAIAYAHPGEVSGWFADSVQNLLMVDAARDKPRICRGAGGILHIESGPRIASARNILVRRFLERFQSEWLWMLDSDMQFTPDTLYRLLEVADKDTRPIVGALCFAGGRSDLMYPTMYQIVDPKENDGSCVIRMAHYPENEVVQVDATGAACLLMHRSALQKMAETYPEPAPWFLETIWKGVEFGEDWTFCIRAGRLGIPIYVYTGAKTGHVKRFTITEDTYKAWLEEHEVEKVTDTSVEWDGM